MDSPIGRNLNPEKNSLYSRAADLGAFHWERLEARGVEACASGAGCSREGGRLLLPFLGEEVVVDPEARRVFFSADPAREPGFQRALVAVAYLAGALDAPPSGRFVAPRELPGGDSFFRGPHGIAEPLIARRFGSAPGELLVAGALLGGSSSEGGDAAIVIPALPRVALKVLVWGADEEFPARAALLIDSRSHLHLALDCLWALTNVACSELARP